LLACVSEYILPYDWDWNLSMAFGAILSATDPVAVVALLKSLGASPKLTMVRDRILHPPHSNLTRVSVHQRHSALPASPS
jgi:hypothetical protein